MDSPKTSGEARERKRRVRRTARAVAAYVEAREQFQKGTAPSFFNIESDHGKSESSPPHSDYMERFYADPANVHATGRIDPVLRRMEALGSLLEPFRKVEEHPGILRRWGAGETAGDRHWMRRFEALCLAVAEFVERGHPGEEIRIYRRPEDAAAVSLRQAAARDREEGRRGQWARSHRIRYANLRRIEQEYPDATREAAKAMWSDRHLMSVPTIRDSIRFCEKHVWPSGEPVERHLRWTGDAEANETREA